MNDSAAISSSTRFLDGGGELGALMRAFDWRATALGAPAAWPQSLKTAVRIMLTSRQPIWIGWGPELTYLYNDPYKSIIGGKHPHALGRPFAEVWREIYDVVGPMAAHVMQRDEGTYVESQLLIMERHGYQEETYYTFSYSPIPDDSGRPGGLICANTDDTQRVIGERQIALLRDLAARSSQARDWREACALGAEALERNPRDLPFALLYVLEPDGRTLSLAASAGIAPGHDAAPASIALEGDAAWPLRDVVVSNTLRVEPLRGRFGELPTGAWPRPPIDAALVPIAASGQTGRPGVLVAGLNPFRRFDESYSSFLELVARQLSASIAHAQAYEEERRRAESLAELDAAKTTFFSNVSHEFRTPLTLMLGPLDDLLAAPEELNEEQRSLLAVARRSGQRLQKLVNTLLDVARIEAGRAQANYEPTDIAALTGELAGLFREVCERAGLRLVVDCPPLPERALVDHEMWEKIVLNLVSNAFKYTLAGEIAVTLRVEGDDFALRVRDTGVGIPANELPRMFERFHRVAGTQGRSYEGTGIGLALVNELVKLHGGSIAVESALGAGTTFTVRIPRGGAHVPFAHVAVRNRTGATMAGADAYVAEASRWIPDDATAPVAEAQEGKRSAARIVVADDNSDLREYVRRLLADRYDVEIVADGEEALAAARARPPDLIVSDVMMPRLDGFGLIRALRADPALASIPVILLSARAGEEARLEGLGRGADDYLAKPFSAREFLVRIGAMLETAHIRDEANHAIVAGEERLRVALEAGGLGAWELDVATGKFDGTSRLAELHDVAPGVLDHGAMLDRIHADDRERVRSTMRRAIDERDDYEIEYRVVRHDGSVRWIGARGRALCGDDARATRLIGVAVDVTERKHAETALRDSEQRMREFADAAPAMLWVTDPEGNATFLSRGWHEFTGQSASEALGLGWLDAVHPDDRRASGARFMAATQRREPFSLDYRVRRHDGEYRWAIDSGQPRFGPDGAFLGFIGAVIDVHERREAEIARRESEVRFAVIVGQTSSGIAESDLSGRFTFANPTFCAIVGRTQEELQRLRMTDVTHPDDREPSAVLFERLVSQGTPFSVEKRYLRPDGSSVWCSTHVSAITDADGRPRAVVAAVQDISERKRAEAVLKDADRRKDEFLATLSHELRNPLSALRNAVQVLRLTGGVGGDALPVHDMIDRQVHHLVRLVDDLLELSRITRGAFELRREPVELAAVLRSAIETSEPLIARAGHRLALSLPGEPVPLDGDPVRLAQVFSNILNNAAKYTTSPGDIALVALREGDKAVVRIRDSGLGIERAVIGDIFEMFSRGHEARRHAQDGLGIGLALARRLAEMHGGTITAASEGVGRGSEFTVTLPVARTLAAPAVRDAPAALNAVDALRVLVVDDSPDAADSLTLLLRALGAEVAVARDGPAALAAFESFGPDLVLLDIGMPGMDGYEVVARLRRTPPGASVPIVALSGWGQDEDRRRSREAGFDDHLVKPADVDALRRLMASAAARAPEARCRG